MTWLGWEMARSGFRSPKVLAGHPRGSVAPTRTALTVPDREPLIAGPPRWRG
jgi:hypothetical protein